MPKIELTSFVNVPLEERSGVGGRAWAYVRGERGFCAAAALGGSWSGANRGLQR